MARQTNAVWVMFVAGTNMLSSVRGASSSSGRNSGGARSDVTPSLRQLVEFVRQLWQHKVSLVHQNWSLLLAVAAFVAFVVKNGGIVLGKHLASL